MTESNDWVDNRVQQVNEGRIPCTLLSRLLGRIPQNASLLELLISALSTCSRGMCQHTSVVGISLMINYEVMCPMLLPLEMIEYIIDYLHDDNIALKTCSLVSKEWTNPSHYHLFHFIKVVDDTSLTKLRDFANILVASTLGRFIRHLHLYNGSFGVPLHGVEIDPPLLLSILAPLRQLRTIQFSSMYWRTESLLQTELQLPLVIGLSVTHFPHKYETYGIPALLHLFPNLKELRVLLDCFGEYPNTSLVHGLPLPPNLRLDTLHFMSPLSTPSLIEAITSTDSLHCLRILNVEVSTIDYLSPLGRFLRHSGSTLKHLTLDISDTDDATDLAHLLGEGLLLDLHEMSSSPLCFRNAAQVLESSRNQ